MQLRSRSHRGEKAKDGHGDSGGSRAVEGDEANKVPQTDEANKVPQTDKNKHEGRQKLWQRFKYGMMMTFAFIGSIYLGHGYIILNIFMFQLLAFRELVNLRFKSELAREVPLFRTIQWAWYSGAVYFTYGEAFSEFLVQHCEGLLNSLPVLRLLIEYHHYLSFCNYVALFVITTLSLKKGYYKYQMGQLAWTLIAIALVVVQFQSALYNTLHGLFWFFMPMTLIICNDVAAYFVGRAIGRKLIDRPLLRLSPNKTWEGFLGGAIITAFFALYWPTYLASFEWLICPPQDLFSWKSLNCQHDPVFLPRAYLLPSLLQPLLGRQTLTLLPVQLHSIVLGLFASLIGPFGGFFASGMKRAYEKKDFDAVIPGHGGFMDRFDCQLIMMFYVRIHLLTFVMPFSRPVERILHLVAALSPTQKEELLQALSVNSLSNSARRAR